MSVKMRFAAIVAALGLLATLAVAGDKAEVTLSGKVACAHCVLHSADAKECQSVLVVDQKGTTAQYYLVKNDVSEKLDACGGAKEATVTGTVDTKDGKSWLTASKIEAPAKG